MYRKHLEEITQEYISWMKQYGNNRNNQDLRFGQYICNLFNIHDNKVFNEENTVIAYAMMLEV